MMKTWLIEEWRDDAGLWGGWVSTHFRFPTQPMAESFRRDLERGAEFGKLRVIEE